MRDVGAGAHALLTTPGAGKWYRSAGRVGAPAASTSTSGRRCVEWLPQETIVFDGALADIDTRGEPRRATRAIIGWEILCLGRTGSGERFDARRDAALRTAITRDGTAAVARARRASTAAARLLHVAARARRAARSAARCSPRRRESTPRCSPRCRASAARGDARRDAAARAAGRALSRRLERSGAAAASSRCGRCCGPRCIGRAAHDAAHLETPERSHGTDPARKGQAADLHRRAARRAAQGARAEAQLSGSGRVHQRRDPGRRARRPHGRRADELRRDAPRRATT